MQRTRVRRVGALVLGLSLIAAACGGDDDDEPTSTDTAVTTATEATGGTETTDGTEETAATEDTEATEDTSRRGHRPTETEGERHDGGRRQRRRVRQRAERRHRRRPVRLQGDHAVRRHHRRVHRPALRGRPEPGRPQLRHRDLRRRDDLALAVEQAGDDGIAHASEINGITRDGEKCTTFADCKALIEAGTDIDYDGISGPLHVRRQRRAARGQLRPAGMGDNNRIDPALTEYIEVTGPPEADVAAGPRRGHPRR